MGNRRVFQYHSCSFLDVFESTHASPASHEDVLVLSWHEGLVFYKVVVLENAIFFTSHDYELRAFLFQFVLLHSVFLARTLLA